MASGKSGTKAKAILHFECTGSSRAMSSLEDSLERVDGILSARINYIHDKISVEFDPRKLTVGKIREILLEHERSNSRVAQ